MSLDQQFKIFLTIFEHLFFAYIAAYKASKIKGLSIKKQR